MKMRSKNSIIAILFILGTFTVAKKNKTTVCSPLRYLDKADEKPDLLIGQRLFRNGYQIHSSICRIKNSDTIAKTVIKDTYSELRGMSYDSRTKTIYRSDFSYIEKISLDSKNATTIFSLDSELAKEIGYIASTSLDWITSNLYILFDNAVGVINLKEQGHLINFKILFTAKMECGNFSTIAVHPNKGYFFINFNRTAIVRFNLDGTNNRTLAVISDPHIPYQCGPIDGIALDYQQDKIFWTLNDGPEAIQHMNLDGSNLTKFQVNGTANLGAIAVDQKYVYYQEKLPGELLLRSNKINRLVDPKFKINRATVFEYTRFYLLILNNPQDIKKNHPCEYNNGGCSKFCFAIPDDATGQLVKKCG